MFPFTCPDCGKALKVKEDLAGKRVKCPRCGAVSTVPANVEPSAALSQPGRGSPAPDFSSFQQKRTLPAPAADLTAAPPPGGEASGSQTSTDGGQDSEVPPAELTEFLAPAQAADEIGRLGPYRVLAVLGHGGMGVVYRAHDPHLDRLVALKVMLPALAGKAANRERFLREARAAAAVKDDHVVGIFQISEDRGVPFVAMEFLEGEPLDVRLERGPALSPAEVIRIGRETALGLAAAHEKGLVHRDIKPGNLWLERKNGRVKILDFGLARAVADQTHLTQSGAIVGTPAYMAPEQATGGTVDHRCDLFSLGCVLYRLGTGQMPFPGQDTLAILSALALETPAPPHEVNPGVPRPLSDLIMRLLAKKPEGRPATAREVADALRALAEEDQTVELRPAGPRTVRRRTGPTVKQPRPGRRRRPVLVGVGVAALLLAAGAIALVASRGRPPGGAQASAAKAPDPKGPEVKGPEPLPANARKTSPFPPLDPAWLKAVAAMEPRQQLEAVKAELMKRNPGFDGKIWPREDNGVVAELAFTTDKVTDIAPVRALAGLQVLRCGGSYFPATGQLSDLSPLEGLKLSILDCRNCKVADISPLKGMQLKELQCPGTQIADLSPLKDMKLTTINCGLTNVTDLSPLKGMRLEHFVCDGARIADLSPLKDMPITYMQCQGIKAADLSALKDMPLKELKCDFQAKRDAALLRSIRTLETINGKPAGQFWKEVDGR